MTPTSDESQRKRALTDLDATLLVEASAGTGKTSLLAGRVTMLLSAGHAASSIAAITFTERAASELRARVDTFVSMLANSTVPKDLQPAFRHHSLDQDQLKALARARSELGDLTASTIHSFCLSILQSYAVEACIDPGAAVMDADQTDLVFDSIFESWLHRRLGNTARPDDPIVVMAAYDPALAVKVLRALAKFRRGHPEARPLPPPPYADDVHQFADAVTEYRRWINRIAAPDQATDEVAALEELANALASAKSGALRFSELWRLVHPTSKTLLPRGGHKLPRYKDRVGQWSRVLGKIEGRQRSVEGKEHYERCVGRFADCMGAIADTLLARFFGETDDLLSAFHNFKCNAALLDFDDILIRTRDLLRGEERVRSEVAARYRHILVDEYQDTDPLQSEILFLIAGMPGAVPSWDRRQLRPGALFMVGDPKQAIYRFRGADLKTYLRARTVVNAQFPGNVIQVSANFRSGERILRHVDQVFADRLAQQQGGYSSLTSTVAEDPARIQSLAKLSFDVPRDSFASQTRELEATAVADLCAKLIGNVWVRRSTGEIARAEPGDIALLAPRRTELWRYEHGLAARGLSVASQAGKNLYRRQEAQDFVALVRALADSRDTLALGAVLRGPLVGLSESDLLDITQALRNDDRDAVLNLSTDLSNVHHPLAHNVMRSLQELWRKRRGTTPYALLSEAVERLRITASIAGRNPDQRARSLRNLALFLERARGYDVRGLKQLAVDLSSEWDVQLAADEAPRDHRGNGIEIVSVHRAKGLEWPIVIPINFVTMPEGDEDFFFNSADDSVHWTLGDVLSSTLEAAVATDRAEAADERERLLYVACTRALDLLVLPAPSWVPSGGWAQFLDLRQSTLSEIKPPPLQTPSPDGISAPNRQTAELFVGERERIALENPEIEWRRPSLADVDRELLDRATIDVETTEPVLDTVVGAGALRGIVLHKLMEELLTGLVVADQKQLVDRATVLMGQLDVADTIARPDPKELARTAVRTITHKELKPYTAAMVPEVPMYGAQSASVLVTARADAVAFKGGAPVAAFDWKSDVTPTPKDHETYVGQLLEYLALINAEKGAIVYMTSGDVRWVRRNEVRSLE